MVVTLDHRVDQDEDEQRQEDDHVGGKKEAVDIGQVRNLGHAAFDGEGKSDYGEDGGQRDRYLGVVVGDVDEVGAVGNNHHQYQRKKNLPQVVRVLALYRQREDQIGTRGHAAAVNQVAVDDAHADDVPLRQPGPSLVRDARQCRVGNQPHPVGFRIGQNGLQNYVQVLGIEGELAQIQLCAQMRDEFFLVTDGAVRIDEGKLRDGFARAVM